MIPSTTMRVPAHTPDQWNERIRQQIRDNVAYYSAAGPQAIERRLQELDREWDIERVLETNAASVALAGMALGATVDRRWFFLPAAVAGFLLQHAIQGWCPPVPLFRRLGVRTATEIDEERYALKAARGDFKDIPVGPDGHDPGRVDRILRAIRH